MKRLILVVSGLSIAVWLNRGYGAWIEGGNPIPSAFTNMVVYDTPGTYIFTVPDGVYKIKVELWGGGGAGDSASSSSSSSSYRCGGGGGGYGMAIIDVTPSMPCAITVGNGGTSAGSDGENTTITCGATTYTAYGGKGARRFTGGCSPGVGGTSNAPFKIRGETGGRVILRYSSGWFVSSVSGANGGASPRGGFGSTGYSSSDTASAPGGGGFSNGFYTLKGAHGRVVIWY